MELQAPFKLFGLATLVALIAFVAALAVTPAVQAADVSQDVTAPLVMQENGDDDENGVTEDENGVTDDDDDAVTDDDEAAAAEPADEVAPAETGTGGLAGVTGSGFALGAMLLGLAALIGVTTAGRFATRRQ